MKRSNGVTTCLLLLALLLSALLPRASALEISQKLEQYLKKDWDTEDGLPQNAIHCIVQDNVGFIWLGTESGLVRFDGLYFEVFTEHSIPAVPNNYVSSLLVARDGTVWAGTRTGGLCRYRNGRFETPAQELLTAKIFSLAEGIDGTIWAATDQGLLGWDGRAVKVHGREAGIATGQTSAVVALDTGDLLVGTDTGDVWRFSGGRFHPVVTQQANLPGSTVRSIAFHEKSQTLWTAHDGAGLYRYRSGLLEREKLSGKEFDFLNHLMIDHEGSLWVGTQYDGLFLLKDGTTTQLSKSDGISDTDVLSIFQDRERSIWIGTHYAGLHRFNVGTAITLTETDGLTSSTVTCVVQVDPETFWLGTRGGGILKFSHCEFTSLDFGTNASRAKLDIRALLQTSAGELWFGTHGGGVGRFDTNKSLKFFSETDGLENGYIGSIAEVNGEVWIGLQRGGLMLYDRPSGRFIAQKVPPMMRTHIRAFAADHRGGIWIGTQSGLSYYAAGEFLEVPVKEVPDLSVRALLCEPDGTLWIGSRDHGLVRRSSNGQSFRYDSQNGLVHNRIYHILGTENDLFIAGNQGIERVHRANLEAVAEGKDEKLSTRLYTRRDGLRTSECGGDSNPSALVAADGSLWFGTREGLTYLPSPAKAGNSEPPNVVIRSIIVGDKRLEPAKFKKLLPGETRVQFDFTALALRNPANVLFKYRLESQDAGWRVGSARSAVYHNLKPGEYNFQVKACNDDGIWNEIGATLAFSVVPRFYQVAWFQAAAALSAVSLLLGGYRWRVRQIRGRNRELERVVSERTSELRQLNEELETRVISRTAEVRSAYENLQIELHERQQAEQALARSESRLRRIVDSGMVGILFWNKSGGITDANTTFLNLVGYSREELESGVLSWEALTPPEFLSRDAAALEEIEKTGVCTPFEKEYLRKDGTRVPILIGGASFGHEGEKGVCFVLDISKLKETEEQIRQLNLQLEARVQERTLELGQTNEQLAAEIQERRRVAVALSAFSHLGQRLHATRTEREAAEIVAQTAKSLIPHDVCTIELYDTDGRLAPVLEIVSPEASQEPLRCSISVSIRNGSRVVGVIGLKNSQSNSFNYSDANTLQALGDYCGGALERIHAEEARRETERRFSTFMTNAPALAWMKDESFRYVFTNEMFQKFIGLPGALIEGKTDYDLWPDHVAFHMRTNDTDTVKSQAKLETQEELKRHDGETRTLLTLRFLFTTATGEQFVAGMAVDITEQKRAEEALHRLPQSIIEAQEAERRRVARELHDGVNQAIASVKFRIQTAEQQILRADPRWQETCNKTKEMLDSVLQQVRRLSRNLRPGELDDFGLVAAARSALQDFELRSGIHVSFTHSEFAERLPAAIELSLYRIIQEALNNVEKHSGATLVEIDLQAEEDYVDLEIADNGCGFDLEAKRGPRSDGGLGLLHLRERASLVGGIFSITTSPGTGVRMMIHVPMPHQESVLR